MKRALLTSACIAFWIIADLRPVRAQIVCANCATEITQLFSWARALINEAKQIEQQAQQISLATQQLTQLQTTYQALTGVRDIGSALTALHTLGIQNPLSDINPAALQGLVNGGGGVAGISSDLQTLFKTNLASNSVYLPNSNDWQAQQLIANATSIAGIQTLVQRAFQAASDRLAQLAGLRQRLAAATTTKDVQDIHAQIAATQASAQGQQMQAQHLQTLAALQPRLMEQQNEQQSRLAICKYIAYLRGNEDGLAAPPDCSSIAATNPAISLNGGASGGSSGGGGSGGGGDSLAAMQAQPWGDQAARNAQTLGVNPEALAATCQVESGCRDVNSSASSAHGPWQVLDGTQTQALREAAQQNPGLDVSGGGINAQSIAASQYLKDAAQSLQAHGITDPTVLDVRGYYNFGPAFGATIAAATPDQNLYDILSSRYTPAQLQANGIQPSTSVGAWRQSITAKLGASASAPVLLGGGA